MYTHTHTTHTYIFKILRKNCFFNLRPPKNIVITMNMIMKAINFSVVICCFTTGFQLQSKSRLSSSSASTRYFSPKVNNQISAELQMDSNEIFQFSELSIGDFPQLMKLTMVEFLPGKVGIIDKISLVLDFTNLFLPKFLFPISMQHYIIGAKSTNGELVGFVDLSLQVCDGSMDVLKPQTYENRLSSSGGNLHPYVCNLLVTSAHRQKGIGKRLLKKCEEKSVEFGLNEIYLHSDMLTLAPMKLYISCGFEPIRKIDRYVFMKKSINPCFSKQG